MGFPFERVTEWRPDFPNDSGGCEVISFPGHFHSTSLYSLEETS